MLASRVETLTVYRLIDPGSECGCIGSGLRNTRGWRICWEDFGLAQKDNLPVPGMCWSIARRSSNICAVRRSLRAKFEVLLYDLTSTYLKANLPFFRRATSGSAWLQPG